MLPNELLLQVFDKLDDATLLECRKVNCQFMEAADKILRDKRSFDVKIHVEKNKDVVFLRNWTKLREIPSATIQAYLQDIYQEELEDPVDYLPPFMTIGALQLDARFLSPARIGETVKILKAEGVHELRKVTLAWKNQHINMFKLMKLIEEAPLEALDLNWYNGGTVSSSGRGFHACLAFMKNVAAKLSKSLFVRGPFSVAEMIDVMREDAINCPKASFLFNKARINSGDGLRAVRRFMESLRDNKRFCRVQIKSMQGRLTLPISEVTRGFNGTFAFLRNVEEKTGNVGFEYCKYHFTTLNDDSHAVIRSYEV
ncbi:hypothetical protein L596_024826 [Steinernema carpocapsae]|uniref:F-box domain-containing protein n=1 Tax=Steinernema carpocapsae TaxID=34508 RepID=A0A4U5M5X4_STECR|nr:hypothetical protein L596_024826 [Steinernema carpocapsae]